MKIQELLEAVVVEAATANLYHGTTLRGALTILQSNRFKAYTPTHSDRIATSVKGNENTVSLTRDINVAKRFANDRKTMGVDSAGVVFVLDQEQLKRDFGKRLRPYDDTSTVWYRQQAGISGNDSLRPTDRTEIEEVIYGDIPNANKYIKRIIVLPPSGRYADSDMTALTKSGILSDPRTVFKPDPVDFQDWKKDQAPKHYLNRLGVTE